MWYVYFIKSKIKDFLYIGSTKNVQKRLIEHNEGKCKSTKAFCPYNLEAYIGVQSEQKARELEKYFKTGSGKVILKKRILSDEAH
jgi:predicted GIY-YIG superfamily endonuclease